MALRWPCQTPESSVYPTLPVALRPGVTVPQRVRGNIGINIYCVLQMARVLCTKIANLLI
jgi:hypothetical protein